MRERCVRGTFFCVIRTEAEEEVGSSGVCPSAYPLHSPYTASCANVIVVEVVLKRVSAGNTTGLYDLAADLWK